MNRLVLRLAALARKSVVAAGALVLAAPAQAAPGEDGALCVRRHTGSNWAPDKYPIPREAVAVFTYEGAPSRVRVTGTYIAADYGVSGVLFDLATGKMASRYTLVDGWPEKRPEAFGPAQRPPPTVSRLVNPGVVAWRRSDPPTPGRDRDKTPLCVAAEVKYRGRTFRAMQPALYDILRATG